MNGSKAACLAALMGIGSGCTTPQPFVCVTDHQCLDGGMRGTCEASGFCSFPDPTCTSGRRFGGLADADHRNACASDPAEDASTGVGPSSTGAGDLMSSTESGSSDESTTTESGTESGSSDESTTTDASPCGTCLDLECSNELEECAFTFSCACWSGCFQLPDVCADACGPAPPTWDALSDCMVDRCASVCD